MILIIGASGYIGNTLYNKFKLDNLEVVGTYFKNKVSDELIYFNLEDPNLKDLSFDSSSLTHAIICSAITNIDECKRDLARSQKINVESMASLIEQFFDKSIVPIYLSSDYVYDGKKGFYSEEDVTCPCNVYGFQKKIIEDFLKGSDKDYTIARISKIYGSLPEDKTIISNWYKDLRNNKKIYCAQDQKFSLTYINDIADSISQIINSNLFGLYNVCSDKSYSRYDSARLLAGITGLDKNLIVPCSIKDFDFLDERPLDTSLNPTNFINKSGITFSSLEENIKSLIINTNKYEQ